MLSPDPPSIKCHTAPYSTQLRIQHQIQHWIQHQIRFNPIMLYIDSLLKIHSCLTKASCSSFLLTQQLFLYWSPVGLKNRKYSDHLSELPYENKCSVPPGKFQNALVKMLFIFDKSLMPKLTFGERATFTLVMCLSIKWEI